MHHRGIAFASTAISSACGATSSTYHRPFVFHSQTSYASAAPHPSTRAGLPSGVLKPIRFTPQMQRGTSGATSGRSPRNPRHSSNFHSSSASPPNSSNGRSSASNSENGTLANLHELTERIAHLLHVGSIHKNPIHCPKDAPLGYLSANTHVVVLFGKHLIRDQISVEYAKRIITFIKQLISGSLNPDVICFTGGKGLDDQAAISEAASGYAFFRAICEEICLDVSQFEFILEERSRNTKENLRNVIDELRRRSGSQAISACHFTLVSSDYHLIRIQEIHRLSPRQSILFPLEVSRATWNCIFAAYPFCVSRDAATAFLGRAIVVANDLGILLVNLNGAIDDREFLSRENLHRLNETFAKMREMYRVIDSRVAAPGGFCTDMRSYAEILEFAIHDIREVQTHLNPLLEVGASVPREHLELSRKLLEATISRMRSSMDPDRVLLVHDRLAIIDDLMQFRIEERQRQSEESGGSKASVSDDSVEHINLNAASELTVVPQSVFVESGVESRVAGSGEAHRRKMRRRALSNEVTWKGSVSFEGNGKKIARDGPNVVIMDSSAPTGRPRQRRGASTNGDGLSNLTSGRALTSTQQILCQTSVRAVSSGSGRRRTSSPSSSPASTSSSAARKPRQTNAAAKKRKSSSSRNITSSTSGDSP